MAHHGWKKEVKKPPPDRPGGIDSRKKGCTCPNLENRWGHGRWVHGTWYFYVEDDCPMHGGGKFITPPLPPKKEDK